MTRLLILSCSQRKRPNPGLLPAIERYDGPAFRVLRRYLRHDPAAPPTTLVLSAEYGLIPADTPIPDYDRRMTPAHAEVLRSSVLTNLRQFGEEARCHNLLVSASNVYLLALEGYENVLPSDCTVTVAVGTQGVKLATLYDWLYGQSPSRHSPSRRGSTLGGTRLRGVEVGHTSAEVFEIARRALAAGKGDPIRCHSWYVLVDDQPVAPKWLASQLTGLQVSDFTTSEARSMLTRLGIEVQRR